MKTNLNSRPGNGPYVQIWHWMLDQESMHIGVGVMYISYFSLTWQWAISSGGILRKKVDSHKHGKTNAMQSIKIFHDVFSN